MPSPLNVNRHGKPSTAYAEAAERVSEILFDIGFAGQKDCSKATWIDAETMTRLAMRLEEIKRQFCGVSE
jgi:hypothetical protein